MRNMQGQNAERAFLITQKNLKRWEENGEHMKRYEQPKYVLIKSKF